MTETNAATSLLAERAATALSHAIKARQRGQYVRAAKAVEEVLDIAPDHLEALLLRVDLATDRRSFAVARKAVNAALRLLPDSTALLLKKAAVLRKSGDPAGAVAVLTRLTATHPAKAGMDAETVTIHAELATALRSAGQIDAAEAVLLTLPEAGRGLRRRLMGLAEVALARGQAPVALELAQTVAAKWPKDVSIVRLLGRVLTRAGSPRRAAERLQDLLRERPGDRRVMADLAVLLSGLEEDSAAEALRDQIPDWAPERYQIAQTEAGSALARGDIPGALTLADRMLDRWPRELAVFRLKARILMKARRPEDAGALLQQAVALRPADTGLRIDLARAMAAGNQRADARTLLLSVPADDPQHRRALAERADLALAMDVAPQERVALAQEILELPGMVTERDEDVAPSDRLLWARLMLACCTLTVEQPQLEAFVQAFGGVTARPEWLNPARQFALIDLAQRVGREEVADRIAQSLRDSDNALDLRSAMVLLERAIADPAGVDPDSLTERLSLRLPVAVRRLFLAQAATIVSGAAPGLAALRRSPAQPRSPDEAAFLGVLLMQMGRFDPALRYLARCLRRWPGHFALIDRSARIMARCGRAEQALALLDREEAATPALGPNLDAVRAALLFQLGEVTEADALWERLAADHPLYNLQTRLLVAMSCGDHARAERLVTLHNARVGGGARNAFQFSVTLMGTKQNDALLEHRDLWPVESGLMRLETGGEGPGNTEAFEGAGGAHLLRAGDLFFTAKTLIDRWCLENGDRTLPVAGAPAIPPRIFQYWDSPDLPEAVNGIVDSWRAAPGFSHVLLHRRDALTFLRDRLGQPWLRAFQMTGHVAEAADFFRLCWLLVEGGIYADADDRLLGGLDLLTGQGQRLILVREPMGSLANNFIAAAPGHPAIGRAALMARDALLRRENDNIWSKTGPGLLTRAIAAHLQAPPDSGGAPGADGSLAILRQHTIAAHVQFHVPLPYKRTGAHWNR
ncbi:MAG: tetratricopeptide repeat protein [Pararhodobacter sp.]